MKNTVTKYRLFPNAEKELAFINQMNRAGYRLVSVFDSFYRFEQTEEQHFTIMRAVDKKDRGRIIAMAKEQGFTPISYKFHSINTFLFLDGIVGEADESFLDSQEDRLVCRKQEKSYYRLHSVIMFLLLAGLLCFQLAFHLWCVPQFVEEWELYGSFSGEVLETFVLYVVVSLVMLPGLILPLWFFCSMSMQWYRLAKEDGTGKQALWIQIGLWVLLIPALLATVLLVNPKNNSNEPTIEDLLEKAVLFEDYAPSTEQLGEVYYYCGEFQSDLLLADVMPALEKKGYTFTNYERFLEEGDDNLYYWAKNESLGANLILVECTTEEEAKEIFASAMESSAEYLYIIDQATSYTVTRMGRVVYGTLHSDAAFPDLMEVYGLPLPEKTQLYKGGSFTYDGTVDFDTAVEKAVALGYAPCRYNKMLDEVCAGVQNLLTADGRGFLSIVKLSSLEEGLESEVIEDDRLLRWTYQEVAKVIFDCFGVAYGQESTKFVMISKDTFIAGSSYYVDQFIAQLEQ